MRLPFPKDARQAYYGLLDEVFDSNFWSEGQMVRRFENDFGNYVGAEARAVTNAGVGLWSALSYLEVAGGEVIVPTNTFWATTRAVEMAGATPIFADVDTTDLCLSLDDVKKKVTSQTKAIIVVHIGGHIAFRIDEIAAFCKACGIPLIEDCAHPHGATWQGKAAGTFGFAGAYSFYATKSLPTGEGGMVVSSDPDFIRWLEKWRNYGKQVIDGKVTYPIKDGFNFRMNEFTAALGIVQLRRFPEILAWKRSLAAKYDRIFKRHVLLPEGMLSGYYKYIVWDYPELAQKTGQVFGPNDLNHRLAGAETSLAVAEWVAEHHQCPPIWYGWEYADKSEDEIANILGVSGCV